MRRRAWIAVLLGQLALVAGLAAALRPGRMPLGVKGEWEWLRVASTPDRLSILFALVAVGLYAGLGAAGMRSLGRVGKNPKAWGWLVALVPAAVVAQATVQEGAPLGYGLAKWAIALHNKGSSGYYTEARRIDDLGRFLADYPAWIQGQDSLHVGTHPPGLFATSWGMLRLMERNPGLARAVVGALPTTVDVAFRSLDPTRPLPTADRAALAATGFLILLACAGTSVPLYALARSRLPASASWAAAAIWSLLPSALMFQPAADAAFPLPATVALALAAWSGRRPWLAVVAGAALGVGTLFTLAFFPVGLVAALIYLTEPGSTPRRRATLVGLTGVGFLAITSLAWGTAGSSPFAIWWANAANHGRFYVDFPRSYWAWVLENPCELAVGVGLPTAVLIACGLGAAPRGTWATLGVLAFLTLSGKNLSEVARLWLPLMPPLVVGAGAGIDRLGARPAGLAATLVLLGVQTLLLEATIQVVYPI